MFFNTFALWHVITLPIKQEKSSTFMLLFRILCIPKMPAPAFWLLTVVRWVTATMLLPSPAILFRVEAWQPHSDIGIPFKVNVGSKLTRVYRTFQVRFIITKPLLFYNCKILTVLCFFVPVSELFFDYNWGPAATNALPAAFPSYLAKFLMNLPAKSLALTSHSDASL